MDIPYGHIHSLRSLRISLNSVSPSVNCKAFLLTRRLTSIPDSSGPKDPRQFHCVECGRRERQHKNSSLPISFTGWAGWDSTHLSSPVGAVAVARGKVKSKTRGLLSRRMHEPRQAQARNLERKNSRRPWASRLPSAAQASSSKTSASNKGL